MSGERRPNAMMPAMLPAVLPSVAHAKLPAIYEQAKAAITECARIDECQEWANKAEALGSYARQAEDHTFAKWPTASRRGPSVAAVNY